MWKLLPFDLLENINHRIGTCQHCSENDYIIAIDSGNSSAGGLCRSKPLRDSALDFPSERPGLRWMTFDSRPKKRTGEPVLEQLHYLNISH